MWSSLVVYLRETRPDLSDGQLFQLTALPLISAAFLRVIYSFMVPIYGGRRWTLFSTAILLVPLLWMMRVLAGDHTPFWVLAVLALLSGLGGAVFASCQANVSLFFPRQQQGVALGINAAIGNSGVGLIQLVIPFLVAFDLTGLIDLEGAILSSGTRVWLTNVPLLLAILIALVCVGIAFRMNDLSAMRFPLRDQLTILKNRHVWILSVLYTFAFGSFIGFAAGFPLVLTSQFPGQNVTVLAFLGVTVGALTRPLGNLLATRMGSARATFAIFAMMILALWLSLLFTPGNGTTGSLRGFLASYALLFAGAGLGIGSVTEMILDIFAASYKRRQQEIGREELLRSYRRDAAASLGITAALATLGAFFMPAMFSTSLAWDGTLHLAVAGFTVLYVSCLGITWFCYMAMAKRNPFLAPDGQGGWMTLNHYDL
ncbi:MAG: hypothetical protein ETSY1_12685 [Candidatus Entotheonella factor]|uniref:Major facilitator superfamily (MFS) profile domain-containing protein n=1 Tax=Entotheonella factor TaxID=1429438 RepID=W4LQN7_ENTF1|nr:MAG: hypothetical protein ETSY1_12685 [Candidatus Entotheonella factor]